MACLPAFYIKGLADCQQKILNNFCHTRISFIASILCVIIHFTASYTFVLKMGLGIQGTGYAMICTFSTYYLIQMVYT